MDKKTIGIIATVISALVCGCASIFSCIWGILLATGSPVTSNVGGVESVQTFPPTVGYVLLCLTVIMILVPVAVGFFTLRKKPDDDLSTAADAGPSPSPPDDGPIPPAT